MNRSYVVVLALACLAISPTTSGFAASPAPAAPAPFDIVFRIADGATDDVGAQGMSSCGGIAPLQTSCSVSFAAFGGVTVSVSGTFTGDVTFVLRGPQGSGGVCRISAVAGFGILGSCSGDTYPGLVNMAASTSGLLGQGGTQAGVGTWMANAAY